MSGFDLDAYRAAVWPMPPRRDTAEETPRRLGVELEFIGVELDTVADVVVDCFGGTRRPVSDYECLIEDSTLGDFGVELDFDYLKRRGRERREEGEGDTLEDLAEGVVALVAKRLVPVEIVAPPIAMAELWRLEDLFAGVRASGAKGTRDSTHYAFGLHLNPEMPALDAATVLRYLQAFLCLYPWLMQRSDVDLSRRVTPYIDPFPQDYLALALAPAYAPSMDALIDDYLAHNATRNRALDMLPLFAHIDEARVRAQIDDERIKARPTLHYRLPNCQVDEPAWGLILPWRDWLQVELLAGRPEQLARACTQSHARVGRWTEQLFGRWARAAQDWVLPELL